MGGGEGLQPTWCCPEVNFRWPSQLGLHIFAALGSRSPSTTSSVICINTIPRMWTIVGYSYLTLTLSISTEQPSGSLQLRCRPAYCVWWWCCSFSVEHAASGWKRLLQPRQTDRSCPYSRTSTPLSPSSRPYHARSERSCFFLDGSPRGPPYRSRSHNP